MWRELIANKASRRAWRLDLAVLRDRAIRRTGLHDFGDPPLEPALATLLQSLEEESDLHPLGRFLIWNHLAELLVTRLRLVEDWKHRRDELEAAPVLRPLFITGMPRSGSTFLHELLAMDPDNRVLRAWEVMFPLPTKNKTARLRDPRIRRAAMELWLFRQIAPEADSVHPVRAESPQECVTIHSYAFLSQEFMATCRVPTYEAWLGTADFTPAYRWQKQFLQHLQSSSRSRQRWVLKSPDHAHTLEALLAVFPDAVIVQTHREPVEVLTSSLQLAEVLHGVFARPVADEERARREAHALADAMEQLLRFRESHPGLAGRFIDIKYADLVANPLATVNRIYERWTTPLTVNAATAMRDLTSQRSRYPKRRFAPDLPRLGRDFQTELWRLQQYCAQLNLQMSR